MDAGGVAEISRWRKPPVTNTQCGEPWKGGGIRVAPFPFGFAQGLSLSNGHRPVRGLGFNVAMNPVVCTTGC